MLGYTSATDAIVHADLVHTHDGAEEIVGALDSTATPATVPIGGLELPAWIDGDVALPALSASSSAALVVRVTYRSGSADFFELETTLSVP